jgi:hypothetical protein
MRKRPNCSIPNSRSRQLDTTTVDRTWFRGEERALRWAKGSSVYLDGSLRHGNCSLSSQEGHPGKPCGLS